MSDTHAAAAAAADTTPPPDVEDVDTGHEERARLMGWRPKDEFKGDPNRWTDAKTFLDRGEKILPIVLERNRALEDRVAKLQDKIDEGTKKTTEVAQAFMEFREFSRRSEERAFDRAKREIESRMNAAVNTADRQAYMQAKEELDALQPPPPKAAEPAREAPPQDVRQAAPPPDPIVQEWISENQWFNRDPMMANYATTLHGVLLREKPGLSIRENLAEVRKDVVARFAEKFGNPRREGAAAVSAPAPAGSRKKTGKSYDDLPPEAKTACDRFVGQINSLKPKVPYTKEEYVKQYFAGEE